MDAAVEAADRAVTAAWQLASDNEHARTPAFANALQADPTLREKLDNVMRPFVAAIAEQLRAGDWDCIEEADAFDRFRQEMLGLDDTQMTYWYRDRLHEADDPETITKWAHALQEHADKEVTRGR
jgi:hypothetical protein